MDLFFIPIIFGIVTYLSLKENRLVRTFLSAGVSFLDMVAALLTIHLMRVAETQRAVEKDQQFMGTFHQQLNLSESPQP